MIAVRDQVELALLGASVRAHGICIAIYDLYRVQRVRVLRAQDGLLAVRVRLPWYSWLACGIWHLWVRWRLVSLLGEKGVSSVWTY